MFKSISVVLPNFNGKDLLERFLPHTFEALEFSQCNYEIIVVDDCSKDDSVSFLTDHYPTVRVIQNEQNKGFAFSCNSGIQVAENDLVLLLNSDIKLEQSYLKKLLPHFKNEAIFGVMGKIMQAEGKNIEVAAIYPKYNGTKLKINKQFYPKDSEGVVPTTFLSGANALIDRQKLLKLDGFDEIYTPFYSEDMDLGMRAWKMGWSCLYDHEATCYHLGSHTTKNYFQKSKVKEIYFRNRMLFHAIHLEKNDLKNWKRWLLFKEVVPKLLLGQFWIWKSYQGFLNSNSEVKKSRKHLKLLMMSQYGKQSTLQITEKIKFYISKKEIVTL